MATLEPRKKTRKLLSMKYWLVNKDPYNGLLKSLYNWVGCHPLYNPENSGTSKSSILIRLSIINHPFWGTPIFGNTQLTPVEKWQRFLLNNPHLGSCFLHSPALLCSRKPPSEDGWNAFFLAQQTKNLELKHENPKKVVTKSSPK